MTDQEPEAGRYSTAESKFVEWSKGVRRGNYDVETTISRLRALADRLGRPLHGLDVGGGIGTFAAVVLKGLEREGIEGAQITVVDPGALAREHFVEGAGLDLMTADFLAFEPETRFDFVVFKTVLHHLVGPTEIETLAHQSAALASARRMLNPGGLILVEENFYESLIGKDVPGRLIFEITRLGVIAAMVRRLGANTAGEGVRFHSRAAWDGLFAEAGLIETMRVCSPSWGRRWPAWQRLPLLARARNQALVELVPNTP